MGVVVVGSYVQDHAWLCDRFPDTGETVSATGFNTGPGGKGFNQAIASHRLGAPTVFIGALGDDALAAAARAFAAANGVVCRWQTCATAPTASSSIIVDAQGDNRIVVNLAANEALSPEFVRANGDAFAARRVLLTQLETGLEAVRAALQLAREHGLRRILNPAPVPAAFDPAILRDCDLITPNETEFALLLKLCVGSIIDGAAVAGLDDEMLDAQCRALGVATVVVTLGSQGCFVSHAADASLVAGDVRRFYRVTPERVNAIDTTGAGDAFSGALAAALATAPQAPFHALVTLANRAAALSTETIGTAPAMPTPAAIAKRFR
ncbi:MAG: ribokinase [Lysobacterales bacterium]